MGWRLLAVPVFVLLVAVRLPDVWRHHRFWAEEATIYFHNAWVLPWWQAILLPANGYLSLAANVAGLLARYCVSVENAPHVTFAVSLLLQTLPVLVLVCARDAWLRPPLVLLVATLLLAMPVRCEEVWLNTANSQFHIALAAALCLALDVPQARWQLRPGLLFLAPLCSPGCVALVPLFIARAALARERGRFVQAICISAGAVAQFAFFYGSSPGRENFSGPITLSLVIAAKQLTIPFLGGRLTGTLVNSWHDARAAGRIPIPALVATWFVMALLVCAARADRRPAPFWLLASSAAIAVLSYEGSIAGGIDLINVWGSQRYAFAPSMLGILCLLSLTSSDNRWTKPGAICAVAWLLLVAVLHTVAPHSPGVGTGPRWHPEVARWRSDPTYAMAIWPTGWHLSLPADPK